MYSLNAAISFAVTGPSKLSINRSARQGSRHMKQTAETTIRFFMGFTSLESIPFLHRFARRSNHEQENLFDPRNRRYPGRLGRTRGGISRLLCQRYRSDRKPDKAR